MDIDIKTCRVCSGEVRIITRIAEGENGDCGIFWGENVHPIQQALPGA